MEALNSLYEDHRLILRVLGALEVYTHLLEQSEHDTDRRWLGKFYDFFETFVGLNHHDKEESVLMPALEHHGFHWNGGTLEHFREEHAHEGYLLRSLAQACNQENAWTAYDVRSLVDLLNQIVAFSRAHIKHENVDVLLTAVHRLPSEALRQIDQALIRFVEEVVTRATHQRLVALGEQLIAQYPPGEALAPELREHQARSS